MPTHSGLVSADTPADDAGRTGLANAWRPTQQDSLLGHVFGLAAPPPLDLPRLLMLQMNALPVGQWNDQLPA